MARNDSWLINGGKSDMMKPDSFARGWKTGDKITCKFDQSKGSFSMQKNGETWVTIEKEITSGKTFYPFVRFSGESTRFLDTGRFSDRTEAAKGDQIEFYF